MASKRKTAYDHIAEVAGRLAFRRAEANFTDGYRTRFEANQSHDRKEAERLYQKSRSLWRQYDAEWVCFERDVKAILRAERRKARKAAS